MPTFSQPVENGQILILASLLDDAEETTGSYTSLLDTGAQSTMISPKVVKEADLKAIGYSEIVPVTGGPIRTENYRIGLSIPIIRGSNTFISGMRLEVALLPFQPDNFDILLGMDFLMSFHLTMYGGAFIISN